jgi:hypothetical protein
MSGGEKQQDELAAEQLSDDDVDAVNGRCVNVPFSAPGHDLCGTL